MYVVNTFSKNLKYHHTQTKCVSASAKRDFSFCLYQQGTRRNKFRAHLMFPVEMVQKWPSKYNNTQYLPLFEEICCSVLCKKKKKKKDLSHNPVTHRDNTRKDSMWPSGLIDWMIHSALTCQWRLMSKLSFTFTDEAGHTALHTHTNTRKHSEKMQRTLYKHWDNQRMVHAKDCDMQS